MWRFLGPSCPCTYSKHKAEAGLAQPLARQCGDHEANIPLFTILQSVSKPARWRTDGAACLLGGMPAGRMRGASSDALEVVHLMAQLLRVIQRGAQHARHLARQQGVRWRPHWQPCVYQRAASW